MSYTTYDFKETLSRVQIAPDLIDKVVAAWGRGDGAGTDAGHKKWSPDGVTEWDGGFLMQMKDGTFLYITGWCDYTGWGCQDGVALYRFAKRPSHEDIRAAVEANPENTVTKEPDASEWDTEPADLNRWLVAPVWD